MISIGGKDPSKQKRKGIMDMLIVMPKHGDAPDSAPGAGGGDPSTKAGTPQDASPGGAPAGAKPIRPNTAQFTDQTETCSQCENFDANGNGGVGECRKGVPEANFAHADPGASRCRFFEDASEEKAESPSEEAAEGEPDRVPA
jgi:hypothetical protein